MKMMMVMEDCEGEKGNKEDWSYTDTVTFWCYQEVKGINKLGKEGQMKNGDGRNGVRQEDRRG